MKRVALRNNYTQSWLLNGTSSYGTNAGINFSSNNRLTLGCWIRVNSTTAGADRQIAELSNNYNVSNGGFLFFVEQTGQVSCSYHDAGGYSYWKGATRLTAGVWYYVEAVFDKTLPATTGCKIYVNGVLDGSIVLSTATTGGFFGNLPFFIGSRAGSSVFFSGNIKDFRICSYTSTFTTDNAQALYAGGVPSGFTVVDEWLGEDSSPTTAVDSGANAKNLTLSNISYSPSVPTKGRSQFGFTPFALTATPTVGYTTFTDIADKERTDAWSVSIWVNIANLTSVPFGRLKVAGALLGWELQYTAGTGFDFVLASTAINLIRKRIPFNTFKPGQYQMVTFTIDGSSTGAGVLGYIDDNLVPTVTVTDTLTTSTLGGAVNLTAGARQGGGTGLTGQYIYPRVFNRVLTGSEVADMFRNNITPASAVQYEWPMSDGSGTTLTASVGGVNGTITTPSWTSTIVPRPKRTQNTVVRIPGQPIAGSVYVPNDRVYTSINNTGITGAAPWSSGGWLKTLDYGSGLFDVALHFGAPSGGSGTAWLAAALNNASPRVWVARLGGVASVAGPIPKLFYTHVLSTYDGTTCTLYINGLAVNSALLTGNATDGKFRIGSDGGAGVMFNGFATMVRLWNRALTPTEVFQVYNGACPTSGLLIKYDMTDGSGNTITDSSGNGNNATGTVLWSTDVPSKLRTQVT